MPQQAEDPLAGLIPNSPVSSVSTGATARMNPAARTMRRMQHTHSETLTPPKPAKATSLAAKPSQTKRLVVHSPTGANEHIDIDPNELVSADPGPSMKPAGRVLKSTRVAPLGMSSQDPSGRSFVGIIRPVSVTLLLNMTSYGLLAGLSFCLLLIMNAYSSDSKTSQERVAAMGSWSVSYGNSVAFLLQVCLACTGTLYLNLQPYTNTDRLTMARISLSRVIYGLMGVLALLAYLMTLIIIPLEESMQASPVDLATIDETFRYWAGLNWARCILLLVCFGLGVYTVSLGVDARSRHLT